MWNAKYFMSKSLKYKNKSSVSSKFYDGVYVPFTILPSLLFIWVIAEAENVTSEYKNKNWLFEIHNTFVQKASCKKSKEKVALKIF